MEDHEDQKELCHLLVKKAVVKALTQDSGSVPYLADGSMIIKIDSTSFFRPSQMRLTYATTIDHLSYRSWSNFLIYTKDP